MMALALPADAELVVVTHLRAALAARSEPYADGINVSTLIAPGQKPARHIRIRRVGGVPYTVVHDSPRIDAQIWYDTGGMPTDEKNRNDLALLTWALLRDMYGRVIEIPGKRVTCGRIRDFLGPTALPDPGDTNRTITGLTVEIGMRMSAA